MGRPLRRLAGRLACRQQSPDPGPSDSQVQGGHRCLALLAAGYPASQQPEEDSLSLSPFFFLLLLIIKVIAHYLKAKGKGGGEP